MTGHADEQEVRTRCLGVDCPECDAGRRHYLATGCTDSRCTREHGRLLPGTAADR